MSRNENLHPRKPFSLSESERLYNQLSTNRFIDLLRDEQVSVREVNHSYNSFGEFLFVTLSLPDRGRPVMLTLYGLGYHEYRERWITDTWTFFESQRSDELEDQNVERDEALRRIREREEEISPHANQNTQSSRGMLYEFLADLTDEDGALTELEDLGDLPDFLDGLFGK